MTTNTTITPELLDQLLANYEKPEDLTGDDGLFKRLKKALIERALGAELTEHLGYEKGDPAGRGRGNSRNGTSSKTVLTDDGEVELSVPRDRAGTFEPQLIAKGQTHFDGFDDKILSLYARGMTVREIQGHLLELYGTDVSPDLISRVTDAVLDESASGKAGRSTRSIRWSSSTRCGSRSATRVWSRTRPSMSRWRSIRTATRTCSGSGSNRAKAPNSGSK
jgi:transposase-like protein